MIERDDPLAFFKGMKNVLIFYFAIIGLGLLAWWAFS